MRFHETTYAPDHNKGMAEGRWDFTLSSADTMIARTTTDGVDYMLFMQAEEGLSAYLIGQPGYDSLDKLRGKLLAGDPGDSNLDLIRKKILRKHGIDDTEYDIEIIGSSPVRLEAFLQRRVVAAMLTPPASDKALAAGGILLASGDDYVPGLAAYLRLDAAALAVGASRAGRALHSRLGGGNRLVAASRNTRKRPCSLSMDKEKLNRAGGGNCLCQSRAPERASIRRRSKPSSSCVKRWACTNRHSRRRSDFTTIAIGARRLKERLEACGESQIGQWKTAQRPAFNLFFTLTASAGSC